METRQIGSLAVSVVGLGCNNFGRRIDAADTERVVHAALAAGVTFFDTADMYAAGRSEEFLGRALGRRRSEAVIGSKFGKPVGGTPAKATPAYIRASIQATLTRLGTDYLDLYQLHEPHPETPIEETLGELADLVRAGQVREIGCSNFDAAQLEAAERAAQDGIRFVSVQNEYSLLVRDPEKGVLDACRRLGLAFIPFFPLASGLLTGKYRKGRALPEGARITDGWGADRLNRENLDAVERLIGFVEARGHTLLELAFSWLLTRAEVASVIAGATTPEQVRANAAAASWILSEADLAELDHLLA